MTSGPPTSSANPRFIRNTLPVDKSKLRISAKNSSTRCRTQMAELRVFLVVLADGDEVGEIVLFIVLIVQEWTVDI